MQINPPDAKQVPCSHCYPFVLRILIGCVSNTVSHFVTVVSVFVSVFPTLAAVSHCELMGLIEHIVGHVIIVHHLFHAWRWIIGAHSYCRGKIAK
jgi:hypothetical protein